MILRYKTNTRGTKKEHAHTNILKQEHAHIRAHKVVVQDRHPGIFILAILYIYCISWYETMYITNSFTNMNGVVFSLRYPQASSSAVFV